MAAVRATFEKTVDEGERRLERSWPALLATGLVGGIDVGLGVFALLVVRHSTHSDMLAALAFTVGFVALTLAGSELFTENFLVPIAAVVAKRASVWKLLRLWAGTLAANLLAGWVLMGLVLAGFPELRADAAHVGAHFPAMGLGWRAFAAAMIGGAVITLMTWMERGTESVPGKLVAAVAAAFLLAGGSINHAIVASLDMFAALHAGAPFGYLAWFESFGWAVLGNMVGGIGLVTVLRFIQVGSRVIEAERDRPKGAPREDGSGGTGAGDATGPGVEGTAEPRERQSFRISERWGRSASG